MPGKIRQSDIQLVRDRSPIEQVIGQYVALRPTGGGQLGGLCPFHDERSPSFSVSPAKGVFYCFGCGEKGDVFSFVQKIDHLAFNEAIERLAGRAGVELVYEGGSSSARGADRGQRTRLVEAHALAQAFYAERLMADKEAAPARAFLAERGFDAEAAQRFGIGYAPRDRDVLTKHLVAKGHTREDLVLGGLARETQRGHVDRFGGRLLWPIRDLAGDVVGFGARKLFDDDFISAKYVNSPETPLFKKSRLLYGMDLAKGDVAKRKQVVVVEGYTDVMACHLAGVTTAVATCGTSFGEEHVGVIRRLLMDAEQMRGDVIFTFDGDAAGQKAALRAAELDGRLMSHTFVAVAPGGKDPCELRQASGDQAVRDLITQKVPLTEFRIRAELARHDLETAEGRAAALSAAVPLVHGLKDESLRDEYARRLAGWIGDQNPDFVPRVLRMVRGGARGSAPAPARPGPRADGVVLQTERGALIGAVQHPADATGFDEVSEEAFLDADHQAVRKTIGAAGGVAAGAQLRPEAWGDALVEAAPDDRVRGLLVALMTTPIPADEGPPTKRWVAGTVAALRTLVLAREVSVVKGRLERMAADDPAALDLYAELHRLELARRALSEQRG
ncbi:MAG TPA: DNA primase [Mycobacteriales bacterium]|nr:DNA primase [Mycobacteriales bacterium]